MRGSSEEAIQLPATFNEDAVTYLLTLALDAPDMLHLNPKSGQEDGCGGRTWGTGDLEADRIISQEVDEATALALLDKGEVVACRRCDIAHLATDLEAPELEAG